MLWEKKKKDKKADEPEELIEDEYADEEWVDDDYEDEEEEQLPRKQRILRSLRNAAISFAVLLVVAVGGGAVYIWYMGEHSPPDGSALAKLPEPTVIRETKRGKRDPNAPFGASVQMLNSPVTPGSNTDMTVKSVEGVNCTISVEINKVPLQDSGLAAKDTDEYGMVTWSWTVPGNAPLGTWPVKVTCVSPAKKSAVVQGDLVIVKSLPTD